jgi:hypothetical protein
MPKTKKASSDRKPFEERFTSFSEMHKLLRLYTSLYIDKLPEIYPQEQLVSFNGHLVVGEYIRIHRTLVFKKQPDGRYKNVSKESKDGGFYIRCEDGPHRIKPDAPNLQVKVIQKDSRDSRKLNEWINQLFKTKT